MRGTGDGDGDQAALGVIADDLTGAADIAGVLARAGARTRLVVGVPSGPAGPGADALVVALKSRSAPVAEAVGESLAALRWLRAAGVAQVVQKVCSTFDSTSEGNIGPVALALLGALGASGAAVCPAYPANGRRVFMGHLFVHDRLLSESGMQHHPLTPMTDPDLRRWLARQAGGPVGHLPLDALRAGQAAEVLAGAHGAGTPLVVCDAVADEDLLALGRALAGAALVVGGAAVAMGLPANLGIEPGRDTARAPRTGSAPGLILAGSCSAATLAQVERHAGSHPARRVDPAEAGEPDALLRDLLSFLRENRAARPLVFSSAAPEAVAAAQAAWGREALASRLDAIFARLAAAAMGEGFGALVVAGGETSGAVAQALASQAFDIGAEIAPGVPTLYAAGGEVRGLVLKSGNFGGPDFFSKALDALEEGR